MKAKIFLKLSLIILISFLSVTYTIAQAGRGRGRMNGEVTDEEGNPIVSANVVITLLPNEKIKRETTTNKKGKWAIIGLGTGDWRVTASAEDHLPASQIIYVSQVERTPKITLALKKIKPSEKPLIEDETSLELLEKANQLYDAAQYDEAISLYEEFLKKNPKVYQVHLGLGDCYREKGEFERAVEEYNRVVEQAKNDERMGKEMTAKALAGIGNCYLRKEDLETAQNFFQQSIEISPENEILAYNVGEIYFSNQKIEEAIYYFELASQIKPDWSDPYFKLGYVYLNKTDNEKAIEKFEKFLELEPDSERSATVKKIIENLKK